MDSNAQKVWACLFGIEGFIIICGNALAIRIFMGRKFIICKSSYLLINLTVADMLVGFSSFCTLFEVLYASNTMFSSCENPGYNQINKISFSFSICTLVAALNSLALMALERALAILIPLRFRRAKTMHYIYCIGLSWLLSMLVLLKNINDCSQGFVRNLLRSFMMLIIFVSISAIVLSYTAILIKVKYRPSLQVKNSAIMLRNIKLSKTLMLTTLVALITWLPRFITYILKRGSVSTDHDTSLVLVMIIYSNSIANLFVYAFRMPVFRKELKKMIRIITRNRIEVSEVLHRPVQLEMFTPRQENTVSCSKVSVTL